MGDLDANYVKIGKDLEEYSEELNPQVEVKRDIGGNPNVSFVGYEVQSSVATYYAEIDDPMFTTLFAIANRRLTDDSCKTTKVDVLIDEMGNQMWAYREDCLIVPVSVGGDTSGVQIPFNVYNMGNRVYGTFSFEEKEFTPSSGPEPSAGGILPLVATKNGTYTAPEKRAYSPVVVNVPTNYDISELTVVDNGTYTAPEGVAYDPIVVEVPVPKPAETVPLIDDGQGAVGSSLFYARADHVHPAPVVPSASTSVPEKDGTAAVGAEDAWARGDHVHPLNVDSTNPADLGNASPGTASAYARRDHVHNSPDAIGTITFGTNWTDNNGYYTQTVNPYAPQMSSDSKIDLQPNKSALDILSSAGATALHIENSGGVCTAVLVGGAPSVSFSLQCSITRGKKFQYGTVTVGDTLTIPGSRKLLWENPSPASSFAAQTVAVDLSGYDACLIAFHNFSTSSGWYGVVVQECAIGEKNILQFVSPTNNRVGCRGATVSTTGVQFSACTYNDATNNGYGIPYKIYGIR